MNSCFEEIPGIDDHMNKKSAYLDGMKKVGYDSGSLVLEALVVPPVTGIVLCRLVV